MLAQKRSAIFNLYDKIEIFVLESINLRAESMKQITPLGSVLKEELQEAISDAYGVALSGVAAEAFGGCYTVTQLAAMVDHDGIINQAIALVSGN